MGCRQLQPNNFFSFIYKDVTMNKKQVSKKKILFFLYNIYLFLVLIFIASCGKKNTTQKNRFTNNMKLSFPIVDFAYSYGDKALYGDYSPFTDSLVGPGINVEIDKENNFYINNKKVNIQKLKELLRNKTIELGCSVPVFLLADASIKGKILNVIRNAGIKIKKRKSLVFDFDEKLSIQEIVKVISICNKVKVGCCYLVNKKTNENRENYMLINSTRYQGHTWRVKN